MLTMRLLTCRIMIKFLDFVVSFSFFGLFFNKHRIIEELIKAYLVDTRDIASEVS